MKYHSITKNVVELIQEIASSKISLSTDDVRNWFDIIHEVSTYIMFESSEGHIILVHNDQNELDEIVGIYFGDKVKELKEEEKWEFAGKMFDCNNSRGYDLAHLKQKVGYREFNHFVRALQDATNQEGTCTERFNKHLSIEE